jgi:ATP-dependent Clp protease ATP-binding subunit ClpA
MFSSFSGTARRMVFWARYEAGRVGADSIELEHLLLGFLTEDQAESEAQFRNFRGVDDPRPVKIDIEDSEPRFLSAETASSLRARLLERAPAGEPKPPHGDMPISKAVNAAFKAALKHAAGANVTRLRLLLGIMKADETSAAARYLAESGVSREQVEKAIDDQAVL